MSIRPTQEPTSKPASLGGITEMHPAFAVAVVTRGTGSGRTLFQSDVLHQHTITLSISTAERTRDLHHDWVHPTRELVEIEMSEAQWGALVSSIGLGSGVPVTLRSRETDHMIPQIPFQPRLAQTLNEAKATVTDLLSKARTTLSALREVIESKGGVKATREALDKHATALGHAESNAEFAILSLNETAEGVVSQAKADIEAHVINARNLVGSAGVSLPAVEAGINVVDRMELEADHG